MPAYGVPNKEQFQKFQDSIGAKLYLNGGDILEGGSLTVRVLPWIYRNQPAVILPHLEGWSSKIEKGKEINTPHRFEIGEDIPEDIDWKRDKYNGKPTVATPKNAVSFLCFNRKSHSIQLAAFNQFGFLSSFNDFFTESHDSYVENITEYDIIIKKGTDKKLSVSIKAGSTKELDDEIMGALHGLLFSYELYMQGADPFNPNPKQNINWKEVEVILNGGNKSKETKSTITKPTKQNETKEVEVKEWRSKTTPKGAILGEQDLPTLEKFKAALEKANKTSEPLYHAVVYGINHFDEPEVTEALSEEDADALSI